MTPTVVNMGIRRSGPVSLLSSAALLVALGPGVAACATEQPAVGIRELPAKPLPVVRLEGQATPRAARGARPPECQRDKAVMLRNFGCSWDANHPVFIVKIPSGEVIGTGFFDRLLYGALNPINRSDWVQTLELQQVNAVGVGAGSWAAQVRLDCDASCTASGPGPKWPLSDRAVHAHDTTLTSPGNAITQVHLDGVIKWSNGATSVAITDGHIRTPPGLRCDSEPYIPGNHGGCVYSEVIARHDVFAGRFPNIAHHISKSQETTTHHWGRKPPGGTLLTRLTDAEKKKQNNLAACKGLGTPLFHCDEYPFQSTYQGAALEGAGDCTFSIVPAGENRAHGSSLEVDYSSFRVLDKDPFWVRIVAPPNPEKFTPADTPAQPASACRFIRRSPAGH